MVSYPYLFYLFHIVGWEPSPCEAAKVTSPPSTVVLLNIGNESPLTEGELIRVSCVVVVQRAYCDCVGLLRGGKVQLQITLNSQLDSPFSLYWLVYQGVLQVDSMIPDFLLYSVQLHTLNAESAH